MRAISVALAGAVVWWSGAHARALDVESGSAQQNEERRLLGSSYGFPGTDQAFDYVVGCLLRKTRQRSYFLFLLAA